jgi:pimeloyl-ACP methyl ester carboxylesterase
MIQHKTGFFICTYNGRTHRLYQHLLLAKGATAIYIFTDGLWDEKRMLRSMHIALAQKVASAGAHAVLFDFFGTGISDGDTHEFSLADCTYALEAMVQACTNDYGTLPIVLVGSRFGADIALKIAEKSNIITQLVLIEPLLSGAALLKQMLGRRKITHAMNGMKVSTTVSIGGETYTDQLGYLISPQDEALLSQWQSSNMLTQKKVYLICTKHTRSTHAMQQFCEMLGLHNKLTVAETTLTDFWAFRDEFDYTDISSLFLTMHHAITQIP